MTNTCTDHTATWVEGFQRLVVLCVENRTFTTDNGFTREARRLAILLSECQLRARNVVRLHHEALDELVDGESAERAHALLDAGEETLIAVLGFLADTYLLDHPASQPTATTAEPLERSPEPGGSGTTRPTASSEVPSDAGSGEVRLHLVVAGHNGRTRKLERMLQELVELRDPGSTEIVVSDLSEKPELFEQLEVLATPVIIRELPAPVRRLVGSGGDLDRIIDELELSVPAHRQPAVAEAPPSISRAPGEARARRTG